MQNQPRSGSLIKVVATYHPLVLRATSEHNWDLELEPARADRTRFHERFRCGAIRAACQRSISNHLTAMTASTLMDQAFVGS